MKPQKILNDGRTEASALLFAHDGQKAKTMLLDSYTEEEENRKHESLRRSQKRFID